MKFYIAILMAILMLVNHAQNIDAQATEDDDFDFEDQFPSQPENDFKPTTQWPLQIQKWGFVHLELVKRSSGLVDLFYLLRFTGTARIGMYFWDCVYDAWVATAKKGDKPFYGDVITTSKTWSEQEINEAVSYAAYTANMYAFAWLGDAYGMIINQTLVDLGYSLNKAGKPNTNTASGIGVKACQSIIARADKDNTNYLGNNKYQVPVGTPITRLSDYTNYNAPQDAMPFIGRTDCDTLRLIDSWQPSRVRTAFGATTSFVRLWPDSVFANMKPTAMLWPGQLRPGPVPKNITTTRPEWLARNELMVTRSAALDDNTKAMANFWQGAEGYSGNHWMRWTLSASRKANLNLEKTIKLHILVMHAQMEGYIIQYEGKRFYQAPRPTTPVQCVHRGKSITTWLGPWQGVGTMADGNNWTAYFPDTLVNNATPEYPCGHCTHSGAVSIAFKRAFNSDTFIGYPRVYLPGTYGTEPKITNPSDPRYVAGLTDKPNKGPKTKGYAPAKKIPIGTYSTWSEMTRQAADSRVYLGAHYQDSVDVSYENGKRGGELVCDYIQNSIFRK